MSFSVWPQKPPFVFSPGDAEQVYQIGDKWVVTDNPARATQAEIDACLNPPPPPADQLEADALAALNGGSPRINLQKLIKAKMISDLAFRLGVAPGLITGAQLLAERGRIAAIYKAL